MYTLSGLGALSGLTISQLADAIIRNEGYYPGSRAYRNNNPGNLTWGPGMIGTDGGFAVFPDAATGRAALERQIGLNVNRGLTLQEFFTGKPGVYDGYDKSDPSYASKIAGWLGIPVNETLASLISGETGAQDQTPGPFWSSGAEDSGSGLSGAAIAGIAVVAFGALYLLTD